MKKIYRLLGLMVAASALTGCTMFSLTQCSVTNKDLLVSSKSGSTYGGHALNIDSDGTGYASKTTSITYEQVHDSTSLLDLGTTGTQNILVIPVKIVGYEQYATSAIRQDIYNTFFGDPSDTGWQSLSSFYYQSSYQQLLIKGTVSGWYDCGYTTSQINKLASSYNGTNKDYYQPTWTILEKAVAWYKQTYNTSCSGFDLNSDGCIDGVWLVYGCPDYSQVSSLTSNFWAYTYYDYSLAGQSLSLSNPMPYHYCWASYDFMYEMQDSWGKNKVDAHTYIHETGHLLGLDDYYVASDKATNAGPMGAVDMMDANIIDHDAFSKFAFGWVKPYVASDSCTIVLKPSSSTGQCVILPTANGWNGSAFDEYMLLEFYTPTDLNATDAASPYANRVQGFTQSGVRIYHVDARLCTVDMSSSSSTVGSYVDKVYSSDTVGTAVAHSNTDVYNQKNSSFRLIQEMDCTKKRDFSVYQTASNGLKYSAVADDSTLFQSGDSFGFSTYRNSFPNLTKMNDGSALNYSVAFSAMTSDSITLTIVKS